MLLEERTGVNRTTVVIILQQYVKSRDYSAYLKFTVL